MNNDNLDIENLLENDQIFKPLTEGLGFHHSIKDKKEIKSDLKHKQVSLKEDLEKRNAELSLKSIANKNESSLNMGELAPFYSQEQVKEDEIKLDIEAAVLSLESANMTIRFGAWLVDAFLVLTTISIALISIMFTSQIPLSYVRENLLNLDFVLSIISISFMFYAFYFSFFDKTQFSTPGKRLFGLRVVSVKGRPISLVQSLSRVLITAASALTLGLGSILKVQDKLTDTMVINK